MERTGCGLQGVASEVSWLLLIHTQLGPWTPILDIEVVLLLSFKECGMYRPIHVSNILLGHNIVVGKVHTLEPLQNSF